MSSDSALLNVLVIGLGLAGAPAANALASSLPASHRIVAISGPAAAYYSVAALRGSVVPVSSPPCPLSALISRTQGWEEKCTLPLDSFFPAGSRHVVLADTKVLSLDSHSVTVNKTHCSLGFSLEIPFAYAVIATGSTYAFPCRPPTSTSTGPGVTAVLQGLQKEVEAASSVLIVGGGPVGIEFAGEVKAQYPKKTVTLVHSQKVFLEREGFKASLGTSLLSQLEKMGVKVVFETRLDTTGLETGKIEEQVFNLGEAGNVKGELSPSLARPRVALIYHSPADFLLIAYGNTPNSSLVQAAFPSVVNEQKRVAVKPTLQLATDDGSLDHIFAIGDITDVAESKLWAHAQVRPPLLLSRPSSPPSLAEPRPYRRRQHFAVHRWEIKVVQDVHTWREAHRRLRRAFRRRRADLLWRGDWRTSFSCLFRATLADDTRRLGRRCWRRVGRSSTTSSRRPTMPSRGFARLLLLRRRMIHGICVGGLCKRVV